MIGASGNVGSEVVAGLLVGGKRVRVLTREASRVAQWSDRVSVAIGDLGRSDAALQAMVDVEGLYLMNHGLDQSRLQDLLVSAGTIACSESCSCQRSSRVSPIPRSAGCTRWRRTPFGDSGVPSAFVRPVGFMSNTFQWITSVRSQGVVHNATGSGQFAPVAPEDIAAVTVRALIDPALVGQAFEVTGEELLSGPQQVEILSRVIGKPLRCVDISVAAAVEGSIRSGVPPHIATALA